MDVIAGEQLEEPKAKTNLITTTAETVTGENVRMKSFRGFFSFHRRRRKL